MYGVATDDMDALTFGTPKLIRHLLAPGANKLTIDEFDFPTVLEGMELTHVRSMFTAHLSFVHCALHWRAATLCMCCKDCLHPGDTSHVALKHRRLQV